MDFAYAAVPQVKIVMEDLNNLPPSSPQKPYGQSKSLAIALIISALFLLAAAGVSYWMLTRPASAPQVPQPIGDGSEKVKSVTWVTATNLPASFVRRDQNTATSTTTYYTDAAAGCSITTATQPVQANVTVKQSVLDAAKAAQSYGIATTNATDGSEISIKNHDDSRTYTFASTQLEQTVAVAGLPYTAQRTITAYKQFGQQVATISYSCRTDNWDAKKTELQTFVNAFKVKTE